MLPCIKVATTKGMVRSVITVIVTGGSKNRLVCARDFCSLVHGMARLACAQDVPSFIQIIMIMMMMITIIVIIIMIMNIIMIIIIIMIMVMIIITNITARIDIG